ncbi:Uncharacterised protein [Chlamydia trachomatis]|nr:Uncharacterised protein [Chlamydia trachomatis]
MESLRYQTRHQVRELPQYAPQLRKVVLAR